MKKRLTILLLLPFYTLAQEYLVLSPGNWAYDVEVVVFGRQLAQPDALNINSRASLIDVPVHELLTDPEDLTLFKPVIDTEPNDETGQWQVPLEGEQPKQQALVWVLLQNSMNNPIVNRLLANPTIKPLYFQKWRQPATHFLSPEYVAVTSVFKPEVVVEYVTDTDLDTDLDTNIDTSIDSNETLAYEKTHADYAFDGVVAYSKQKFDHVSVKMNYYRHDPFGQMISYTIDQKQRIKLGEWQYFDHQQFGVMVKVSPVSAESLNDGD